MESIDTLVGNAYSVVPEKGSSDYGFMAYKAGEPGETAVVSSLLLLGYAVYRFCRRNRK